MPLILDSVSDLKHFAGREIGVGPWLTITQNRIDQFAEATEDRQWIHVDGERAKRESPYGATIAHGFLTLALASHLLKQVVEIRGAKLAVNYGLNRVRFPEAVRVGSKIRARVGLAWFQELAGAVDSTFQVTIEVEGHEKPCCVVDWLVRYYR
jgi:acyl dehydratase